MFLQRKEKPVFIWTYHRVLPEKANAAVAEKTFCEQLEYLIKNKYNFITTKELRNWFDGELDKSEKYTMLTFDDGWADNYFYVQPILKEYNIKAVLALNTGLIECNSKKIREKKEYSIIDSKKALYNSAYGIDKSSFLTKSELIKMQESGWWDIQAHGSSHFGVFHDLTKVRGFYPAKEHWTMKFALGEDVFEGAPRAEFKSILAEPLTKLDEKLISRLKSAEDNSERLTICKDFKNSIKVIENENVFLLRIKEDMEACKSWLDDTLKIKTDSMFWPWGHYSDRSITAAKELGFNMLYTMNKAAVLGNTSKYKIPRIAAPESLSRFIHQEKVFSSEFKTFIRNIFS